MCILGGQLIGGSLPPINCPPTVTDQLFMGMVEVWLLAMGVVGLWLA